MGDGAYGEAAAFYELLRTEVCGGNPSLGPAEQALLRAHYPVMNNPSRYPPALVSAIYAARRAPAVERLTADPRPMVLDAGCGFGSESFLFAAAGARVLGVDASAEQIEIARKRKRWFSEALGRDLDVEFQTADLDRYEPKRGEYSLTWFASVLAAIRDQDRLLRAVFDGTRPGGAVLVTDMNLHNPFFLASEWLRRRRARPRSPEFDRDADFGAMLSRRGRVGARYYPRNDGGRFDDVQFFTAGTLARALRQAGFAPAPASFSGYLPPPFGRAPRCGEIERFLGRLPVVRTMGYFYLLAGVRP